MHVIMTNEVAEKRKQELYEEILYSSTIYKFLMNKRDCAIDNNEHFELKDIEKRLKRLDIRIWREIKNK